MTNHVFNARVTPCLRIECEFWLGDEGWYGSTEHPSLTVHANSFGEAKADIELALGKHIESLLNVSGVEKDDRVARWANSDRKERPARGWSVVSGGKHTPGRA
jgi:hypothetical protein